ncbi:MAG: glycogen-binding domain-containing protein [bacterium]|nr:MAG: glycogen-binding domain-containing protein [bacterium]
MAEGAVEKTDEGIKFTYYDPDAGQVHLAGTMNGWSTTATPLSRDEEGYWTVVLELGSGEHEYKFVVDGAWITDIDNPNTKSDPYGGMNSVVEIDSKGELVSKAEARPISNTPLSARVNIGGRYLSRTKTEKGIEDDERWRVQRPVQNVDFNFRITISDMVHGYTRLRIDSERNLLQPNNISAFMDEAHIEINPAQFTLTGYYNREALSSTDPLALFGDIDLPGTIGDDHLKLGKGTAGAVVTSDQGWFGLHGFIANMHDHDFYNDPDLFDNIGTDLIHARLFANLWEVLPIEPMKLTVGGNFFMERNLYWSNISGAGTLPAETSIPQLNEYLNSKQDNSDWFEFQDRYYLFGPDFTLHLLEDRLIPQFEYLRGAIDQGFVTGNNSGFEGGNGPIDVPILERDLWIAHGSVRLYAIEGLEIHAKHSRMEVIHPTEGEVVTWNYLFRPESEANKLFGISWSLAPQGHTVSHSELTCSWNETYFGANLRCERFLTEMDIPNWPLWLYILSISPGLRWKPLKAVDLELESQYRRYEGRTSYAGQVGGDNGADFGRVDLTSFEAILRGSFRLTDRLSAIFDIRNIYLDDAVLDRARLFTAPFVGIEYTPTKKVDLVLAFGLDPLDFGIDYEGRHTGRYNFRQEYLREGATEHVQYGDWARTRYLVGTPNLESYLLSSEAMFRSEEALADKAVVTLRAIFKF